MKNHVQTTNKKKTTQEAHQSSAQPNGIFPHSVHFFKAGVGEGLFVSYQFPKLNMIVPFLLVPRKKRDMTREYKVRFGKIYEPESIRFDHHRMNNFILLQLY